MAGGRGGGLPPWGAEDGGGNGAREGSRAVERWGRVEVVSGGRGAAGGRRAGGTGEEEGKPREEGGEAR